MEYGQALVGKLMARLIALARDGAVVSQPIAIDDRYVVPLCELSLAYGGGGGGGETEASDTGDQAGGGGLGGGGGASVKPLAVLVIDGDDVRIESLCE